MQNDANLGAIEQVEEELANFQPKDGRLSWNCEGGNNFPIAPEYEDQ
ncbi:MAG TPA: hypothetical protein VIB79_13395 [Candidatus Binatia bacterium]|jgi:hypothetical protein